MRSPGEALLISVSRRQEPELTEETLGFRPTLMISFEEANDPLNEGHVNMACDCAPAMPRHQPHQHLLPS
jgi:hypothetical protein